MPGMRRPGVPAHPGRLRLRRRREHGDSRRPGKPGHGDRMNAILLIALIATSQPIVDMEPWQFNQMMASHYRDIDETDLDKHFKKIDPQPTEDRSDQEN